MSHLGYHIRLQLIDGSVIAESPEQRRLVARIVFQLGMCVNLVAMAIADSHLHAQARCDRLAAGRFARFVASSVKQRLGLAVGFAQYEPVAIRDQWHSRSCFKYILRQDGRHGLPSEQVFEGSNAPDLLGLRLVGRYTRENVRRWLPRVRRADVMEWVGLSALEPADGPLELLEEATRAAACAEVLTGRSPTAVAARRAMLEVIGDRLSKAELAQRFGISARSLRWLRSQEPDRDLVEAIRLQLGYRAVVA